MSKQIITTDDVRAVPPGGVLRIPVGAIVTDIAREVAAAQHIRLAEGEEAVPQPVRSGDNGPIVAIGADHGPSFPLKERLKSFLESLPYQVLDCGTYSPEAVDYPDIAYAVAKQVANGTAWRGIIIDGAGIGSAMAANKVPGIRAALCYNQAMAHNSREHNDANVLTLGAGMIGENLAQKIIQTWLETEFAGGRHERRVNKIMQIEKRFLRG